jgi:hypothetical protein
MCQGRKTGELLHGEATEEGLMHLCAGIAITGNNALEDGR